jgi:hypothetical protein
MRRDNLRRTASEGWPAEPKLGINMFQDSERRMACRAEARDQHVSGQRAKVGAEDWNRTSDTSIFSAVLYQLSYLGVPWAEP